jgi:hypothetical protein
MVVKSFPHCLTWSNSTHRARRINVENAVGSEKDYVRVRCVAEFRFRSLFFQDAEYGMTVAVRESVCPRATHQQVHRSYQSFRF